MKLMIKRHQDTGLKYLHYTNREDDSKYLGSGTHWKRHLKKHGPNVISCLVLESDNQKLMTNYALYMSEELDIINSKDWANLCYENCLGGTPGAKSTIGKKFPERGEAQKGKVRVRDVDNNCFETTVDNPRYISGEWRHISVGTTRTEEAKEKMRGPRPQTQGENNFRFGKFLVETGDGIKILISKDDPRYLSGELSGFNKGCLALNGIKIKAFGVVYDTKKEVKTKFNLTQPALEKLLNNDSQTDYNYA